MAKFCGKCGIKLDEQTGKCPNCDKETKDDSPQFINQPIETENEVSPKEIKADKKIQKQNTHIFRIIAFLICFSIITSSIFGVLVYFDVADIPFISIILDTVGLKSEKQFGDLYTNKSDILVGENVEVTFFLNSTNLTEDANIIVYDEKNNYVVTLNDSGEDGDSEKNDGIFSGKVALSSDKREIVQYYAKYKHARSKSTEISYYSEITYKEYEEFSSTIQHISSLEEPYIKDNFVEQEYTDELFDEIEKFLKELKNQDIVEFYICNDKTISVEFTSGITFLYSPLKDGVLSSGNEINIVAIEPTQSDFLNYGEKFSLWIDSLYNNLPVKSSFDVEGSANRINEINGYSFNNYNNRGMIDFDNTDDYIINSEVTVEKLKECFNDKGVVILNGHGAYDDSIHSALVTGESVSPLDEWFSENEFYNANLRKYSADICAKRLVTTSSVFNSGFAAHYAITAKFINQYVELNNAFVYLGACYSGKDSVLADSFLNSGAQLVMGYSDEVTTYYERAMRSFIIYYMAEEQMAANDALGYVQTMFGKTDPSNIKTELRLYGKNENSLNMSFYSDITLTDNSSADQIISNLEYIANQLLGEWEADADKTYKETNKTLMNIFGSGIKNGSSMKFDDDGTFSYYIGIGNGGKGTYTVTPENITYDITTYEENKNETGNILIDDSNNELYLITEYFGDKVYWKQKHSESNIVTDVLTAYQNYITKFKDSYYMLYDMDGNGVPELIIRNGTCEADYMFEFYSYNDGIISCGSVGAGHSELAIPNDEKGLLLCYQQMGYSSRWLLTMQNYKVNKTTVFEGREADESEKLDLLKEYKCSDISLLQLDSVTTKPNKKDDTDNTASTNQNYVKTDTTVKVSGYLKKHLYNDGRISFILQLSPAKWTTSYSGEKVKIEEVEVLFAEEDLAYTAAHQKISLSGTLMDVPFEDYPCDYFIDSATDIGFVNDVWDTIPVPEDDYKLTISNKSSVDEIKEALRGRWYGERSYYIFYNNGTCKMLFDNSEPGTYEVNDEKQLIIKMNWNTERLEWDDNSLTSKKGWCITSDERLIIKGVELTHKSN